MADKTISKARGDDSSPLAISLENINKTFGSVQANKDVCLSVVPGTIHGIVARMAQVNQRLCLSCMGSTALILAL